MHFIKHNKFFPPYDFGSHVRCQVSTLVHHHTDGSVNEPLTSKRINVFVNAEDAPAGPRHWQTTGKAVCWKSQFHPPWKNLCWIHFLIVWHLLLHFKCYTCFREGSAIFVCDHILFCWKSTRWTWTWKWKMADETDNEPLRHIRMFLWAGDDIQPHQTGTRIIQNQWAKMSFDLTCWILVMSLVFFQSWRCHW